MQILKEQELTFKAAGFLIKLYVLYTTFWIVFGTILLIPSLDGEYLNQDLIGRGKFSVILFTFRNQY